MRLKAKLLPALTAASCAAIMPAPAPAGAASPASPAPRRGPELTSATLDACHASPVQSARYATFGAQMTQIRAAQSMEVRFDLYRRSGGRRFRLVAAPAPGFGLWRVSNPGVTILRFSQQVANLPAPASFRVLASYRWRDARRRIVRHEHRTTPVCTLPDKR